MCMVTMVWFMFELTTFMKFNFIEINFINSHKVVSAEIQGY